MDRNGYHGDSHRVVHLLGVHVSQYVMHDTYGTHNLRCCGMEKRPRIKAVELPDALIKYDATPCYLCMPFNVGPWGVVVVEKRAV